jgi:hypothetical protein
MLYLLIPAIALTIVLIILIVRRKRKPAPREVVWAFGGFDGAAATETDVKVHIDRVSKDTLYLRWEKDMAIWGYPHARTDGIACLFVQCADKVYRGGKFEWISSSRNTRSFANIINKYGGWTLEGVPNPTKILFVVVSKDGKKRSNFATGVWER